MNPEESMLAVSRGDVQALKMLYEQFRVPVFAVALSIVRDRSNAEDVLQETFLRVYDKASMYRPGTNPGAWIVSIARNVAYDALRRCNRRAAEQIEEASGAAECSALQKLELTEALLHLGETERQIVVLYVTAGLKHAEIGELLDIPAGTVRWKYRQSLKRLANYMGGEADGAGNDRISTKT